jgi:hypothetical protein
LTRFYLPDIHAGKLAVSSNSRVVKVNHSFFHPILAEARWNEFLAGTFQGEI